MALQAMSVAPWFGFRRQKHVRQRAGRPVAFGSQKSKSLTVAWTRALRKDRNWFLGHHAH